MNHKGSGGVRETKPPFTIFLFLSLPLKTKAPPTNHPPHANAQNHPEMNLSSIHQESLLVQNQVHHFQDDPQPKDILLLSHLAFLKLVRKFQGAVF